MDLLQIGEFIKSTGFPIFVAVFVLLRLEPMMKDLKNTLALQTVVLAKIAGVDYEAVKKLSGDFKGGTD